MQPLTFLDALFPLRKARSLISVVSISLTPSYFPPISSVFAVQRPALVTGPSSSLKFDSIVPGIKRSTKRRQNSWLPLGNLRSAAPFQCRQPTPRLHLQGKRWPFQSSLWGEACNAESRHMNVHGAWSLVDKRRIREHAQQGDGAHEPSLTTIWQFGPRQTLRLVMQQLEMFCCWKTIRDHLSREHFLL